MAEAPSSAGGVLPLANFETAYLGQDNTGLSPTNYATVSGVTDPISSFGPSVQEITMVSSSGITQAQPSPLSTDGTSFSVTWGGSTNTTSSATTTTTTANTTVSTTSTAASTTSSTSHPLQRRVQRLRPLHRLQLVAMVHPTLRSILRTPLEWHSRDIGRNSPRTASC